MSCATAADVSKSSERCLSNDVVVLLGTAVLLYAVGPVKRLQNKESSILLGEP